MLPGQSSIVHIDHKARQEVQMRSEDLPIPGARLLELQAFEDDRGRFMELFRLEWLPELYGEQAQVNCSRSRAGVVRGLHYHLRQTDLWLPVQGELRAVLADARRDSPAFGRTLALDLSAGSPGGLLIPPGVAHGFAAHTDLTLIYVVSRYYDGTDEHGIAWDDPRLAIDWGVESPILSGRDRTNEPFDWS